MDFAYVTTSKRIYLLVIFEGEWLIVLLENHFIAMVDILE